MITGRNGTLLKRGLWWLGLCLVFPIVGLWLSGGDLTPILEFPPKIRYMEGLQYSTEVGVVYWFCMAVLFLWLLWRRGQMFVPSEFRKDRNFPAWGWLAILGTMVGWLLAWTRWEHFAWGQKYTFTPLWLGYILIINALIQWQTGKCPIVNRPVFFALLFPVSAIFWWVFEYYNRFVQNWLYLGFDVGPTEYFLHATICFSTVLPAVYSTAVLLEKFPGLQREMTGPNFQIPKPKLWAWTSLVLCSIAFLCIGIYPQYLYPLLWTGPLLIWLSLSQLHNVPEYFGKLEVGDWRTVWTWALAALICGFFWEMWNFHSYAKWEYQVPFLHGGLLFEMPIAGYLGYLPFGIECYIMTRLVSRVLSGR
jgi:hypothetical protein